MLQAIYSKYGEQWLVDVLYDDLYDWLDFMWNHRREQPLGLICLGSEYVPGLEFECRWCPVCAFPLLMRISLNTARASFLLPLACREHASR